MLKKFSKHAPLVISILAIFLFSYFRLLENYGLATLDYRFKLRPRQPINQDIVIIEISDYSIEKIGRWPFDRHWHANLLKVLEKYGVKAVFFDVIFSEEAEGDISLVEASRKLDVYYTYAFDLSGKKSGYHVASKYITPLLKKFGDVAKNTGYINTPPDIDGRVRRVPLLIEYKEDLYPAASFILACDYLGIPKEEFEVPVEEQSSMLINYPARWKDSFIHLSYIDIIISDYLKSDNKKGPVDLDILKDKVCFIGLTATGTYDMHAVPLENIYPGIGIHVSAFNTLVTKNFITRASRGVNLLIAYLLAFVVALISLRFRPFRGLMLCSSLGVVFIIASFILFAFFRIWIDLFFPAVLIASTYLYTTFKKYAAERKKREMMEKELAIAKTIQQSFLPESVPEIKGLEIEAHMLTAHHVGGDLYDFIDYKDGSLGIMIGDVSGKGVPASLFMAKVVSEFRVFSIDKKEPSVVLKDLNQHVLATSKTNLFVTMSYLLIEPQSKRLNFASGGHLPLILARGDEVKTLDTKDGLAIGMFESEFSEEKLNLVSGDLLVLYTDGVSEAMNLKGEEYGMGRLLGLVKKYKNFSCKEMVDMILRDINSFAGKAPQHDDVTVIVIKIS